MNLPILLSPTTPYIKVKHVLIESITFLNDQLLLCAKASTLNQNLTKKPIPSIYVNVMERNESNLFYLSMGGEGAQIQVSPTLALTAYN